MGAVREADAAAIEHAVGAASRVLGLGRLVLSLWDPGLTRLSVVAEARAGEVRMLLPPGPLAVDGVGDRAFNLRRTVIGSERPAERGRVAAAVPLCDGELTLGVLELYDDAPLADAEVARLEALAPLVTRVVQHSRLVSRLDRERAIVAALADVRAAATQATDPGRCGSLICARLEAILPGVRVSLYVMAPGGGQVEYLAAGSEQAWLAEWRAIPLGGDNIVTRAVVAADFEPQRTLGHQTAARYGMLDSVAVSLCDGPHAFGVLIASSAQRIETEALELLATSARAASVGLALALGVDAQRRAERRARLLATLALADPPDGVRPEAALAWLRGLARSAGEATSSRCLLAVPGTPGGATPLGTPRLGERALEAVQRARASGQAVRDGHPCTLLAIPISVGSPGAQLELGVLTMETNSRAIDPEDEALLTTLVGRVAAAVERGRLAEARRRAEREKDEVLSIVAHELRTPITSLQGFAAASLAGIGGASEARTRRAFEIIERQARRMGGLVSDLLDVTRIERGQLELRRERVDLCALSREAIERVSATAPRHQIELHASGEACAFVDATRVEQLLLNLIGNAVRYSPAGGPVAVHVVREAAGAVRVDVRDQGVGVLPADRARIFERFQRSAGPDQAGEPGLGLGLYIAREIAVRHGGTLWLAESEVGRGSVFSFRLGGEA